MRWHTDCLIHPKRGDAAPAPVHTNTKGAKAGYTFQQMAHA
jgi:hypothetical protein